MSVRIGVDGPDLFLGVVALTVSAGYLYEALRIPESLLADVVGARGVPIAVGWITAALGLILCLRGVLSRTHATAETASAAPSNSEAFGRHLLALGLLAILAMYVVVLPYMGYIASTALLIGAVARFSGAAFGRNMLLASIAGGLVLWVLFDPLLEISLPVGSWWQGR
jgi:putative tricarboxylic transport membrane protein